MLSTVCEKQLAQALRNPAMPTLFSVESVTQFIRGTEMSVIFIWQAQE